MGCVRRAGGIGALCLGLVLPIALAWAQDEPEPETPAGSYEGWGFIDRSPRPGRRYAEITAHPTDPAFVVAVTQSGTTWLSLDAGSTWYAVLDSDATWLGDQSPDEQVRQEVEAEVQEAVTEEGLGDVDEVVSSEGVDEATAVELATDAARTAAEDAASHVQSEIESNPGFIVGQMDETGRQVDAELRLDPFRPGAWITSDDRLYVGRGDALMLSDDLGATWDVVLSEAVNAFVPLPGGGFEVGTTRGFWRSEDGRQWVPIADRTEALEVLELTVSDDGVWAGTSDGLRHSVDGRQWTAVGGLTGKVRAVAVDPGEALHMWVAVDRTVLTSHDGGATWVEPVGAPLPGLIDLLALGGDHVLGAGPGGASESTDGGATWTPRKFGQLDLDAWDLAVIAGRVWLASDEGLARLEPPEVLAQRLAAMGTPPEFVPFDALLTSSLDRPGLGKALPHGARFASSALPQFHVEGRYIRSNGLDYLDSRGTRRDEERDFTVLGWLEWTPAGRSTGTVDVLVSDGDIIVDDGGDQTLIAARIDRRAMEYRRKLATTVTELYYKRAVLVAERATKRTEPLLVRVNHEIAIQEVEARLDALTGGAVSSWHGTDTQQE